MSNKWPLFKHEGRTKQATVHCEFRLVNGSSECSGRVEVLREGAWGTVSDDGWDLSDAAVVCRQLGCGAAIEAKGSSYFGQGSGLIWLDNVACTGNETSLENCLAPPWGTHNHEHDEDARVTCEGELNLII